MSGSTQQELMLSVVIPTHNNLQLLKRCLASWKKVRNVPLELVVIEDGCSDGTAEWLSSLVDHRLRWFHEDDVYETLADNRGMSEACGRYVLIWQDDMILRAAWLVEGALALLERHKEIAVLGLLRGQILRSLRYVPQNMEELQDPVHVHTQVHGEPRCAREVHACVRPWLIRRESLEAHGLLDPAFAPFNWDEHDLHMRLRQDGLRIAVLPGRRLGGYLHLAGTSTSKHRREWFDSIVVRNGVLFHQRWDSILNSAPPCCGSWLIDDWRFTFYGRPYRYLVYPFLKNGVVRQWIHKLLAPPYRAIKKRLKPTGSVPPAAVG